jgi:hypothetical protein
MRQTRFSLDFPLVGYNVFEIQGIALQNKNPRRCKHRGIYFTLINISA